MHANNTNSRAYSTENHTAPQQIAFESQWDDLGLDIIGLVLTIKPPRQ
jgi:hypothetical protein